MYQLILFDFDGTLADTYPWFCQVLNDTAVHFNLRAVGDAEREALRDLSPSEILNRLGVPLWKVPLIAGYLRKLMAQRNNSPQLFPGVPELLRDLHQRGALLGVVSSNSAENVRAALSPDLANLIHYYACGVSMFGKAQRIRRVLARAQILPPHAILVGDEVRDAEAAHAAQVAFGAVSWGYNTLRALQRSRPDHVFASVAELATQLR